MKNIILILFCQALFTISVFANEIYEHTKEDREKSCKECHDVKQDREYIHKPILAGSCTLCHNLSSKKAKLLRAEPIESCILCHSDKRKLVKQIKKNVHPPVLQDCTLCHDPHSGDLQFRLKADKRKDLCLTCHTDKKKWIEDSKNKHGAINLKNGGCIVCHDPHYSGRAKMLKSDTTKDLCLSCHNKELTRDEDNKTIKNMKKFLDKSKVLHSPIKQGDCAGCHNPHGSNNYRMLKSSSTAKLCVSCHADKKKFIKKSTKNVHPPVKKNCATCHDPHAGKNKERLKADKRKDICLTCHKDKKKWIKNVKNRHGAINLKNGGCIACHDPHYTGKPKMIKGKTQKHLCLTCHNKKLKRDEDGKTIKNMKKLFNKNKILHTPLKQGVCSGCHNPHGSNNYRMLKSSSIGKLCVSCHTNKKKFIKKSTKNVHPPVKKNCATCHDPHAGKNKERLKADKRKDICLTCHKDKKKWIKNVKNKHGAINLKNGGCIACHDPHYTGKKKMLKGKTTKDLCLSCHNKELKRDEDGKKLQNIKKHLQQNKKWHEPVKQGNCTGCHNPHGSNNYRMLKGPYPTKSIAPFKPESYVCFNCHQEEKITQRKTTTQTNFRTNEKNLHTIHVKDRSIVCTTCHDVHGAKEPNPLIKNKTQFSGTEFKLRYIKTPDGGSCNPICHNKKEYGKGFSSTMAK